MSYPEHFFRRGTVSYLLCRDAVSVFYNPRSLGWTLHLSLTWINILVRCILKFTSIAIVGLSWYKWSIMGSILLIDFPVSSSRYSSWKLANHKWGLKAFKISCNYLQILNYYFTVSTRETYLLYYEHRCLWAEDQNNGKNSNSNLKSAYISGGYPVYVYYYFS